MKINGRDVTLTSEELDLLKRLKANGVISITKSDEDAFMWHDGDFSTQGSTINVRWFKGFDWMENDETISVQMLLDMSKNPATVWDLKDGDVFWWVTKCGNAFKDTWNSCYLDVGRRSQCNVFLTEEEAVFESKRREVVAKVKKYARPFIYLEPNWYPYFNMPVKRICFSYAKTYQSAIDYFESIEDIKQAIAEVGEDNFKKYYLGVTE